VYSVGGKETDEKEYEFIKKGSWMRRINTSDLRKIREGTGMFNATRNSIPH